MANTETSLLQKYDLELEQLDYKYIETCENVKTLERILIVLRSGQEGIYPDLIKFCENRLRELAPTNRLLHLATKAKRYDDLSENERREVKSELEKWWNNAEDTEINKISSVYLNKDMPPVRGKSVKIETSKKKEKTSPCVKSEKTRTSLRSYSDWDKFDVDGELKKLDESENNDNTQPVTENKRKVQSDSELQKLVAVSDLSEKERQYVAELEKNKGNEAFKAQDYQEAVVYYTRSLSAYDSTITLNNRAQAYIKLKNYFAAIQDCNKILLTESNNLKALYRRGLALKESNMYDLAELDFGKLLELDVENKSAKEQLKQIKQMKLRKPEKKKVVIEEIKSDEDEAPEIKTNQKVKNMKGRRLKIDEVTTTENTEKLTNINYNSSDEDDNTSRLPPRVKQLLQINKQQKTEPHKNVDGNEIEKTPIRESKQNKQKVKITEICEQHPLISNNIYKNTCKNKPPNLNNTAFDDKELNKVVRIDIENSITNKENFNQYKCPQQSKQLKDTKSTIKEADLKITNKNSTDISLDDDKNEISTKENAANEGNLLQPIKYRSQTKTSSSVDYNNKITIYEQKQKSNGKAEMDHDAEDKSRKSKENKLNNEYDKITSIEKNIKTYPDSTEDKSVFLDSILKEKDHRKNIDHEIKDKEFKMIDSNDQINNSKLRKLDESNKNNLKMCKDYDVMPTESNSFKAKEIDYVNEGHIRTNCDANTLKAFDIVNNNILNNETVSNSEPQVLFQENPERRENYDLEAYKYLTRKVKTEEYIPDTKNNYKLGQNKIHIKKDDHDLEDEFVDVESNYSLADRIQKNQEVTQSKNYFSKYSRDRDVHFDEMLNERGKKEYTKDVQISKTPMLEIDEQYEKISPYEFLCTWRLNDNKDNETEALNLLKLKPEELPKIISNKMDSSLLTGILRAINIICKIGILGLFSALECEHGFHIQNIHRILQV